MRDWIEESLRTVVRSTGNLLERHGELPAPPKGLEDVIKFGNLEVEISNWICLQMMFSLAACRDILEILLSMIPTLVHAHDGFEFVTSDQPVTLFSPEARREEPYGVGLTDAATELSMPLSPRTLLLLTWDNAAPSARAATIDDTHEFNRRTIIMAQSYLFARAFSQEIREQVRCNRGRFAGFEPPEVMDVGVSIYHVHRVRAVLPEEEYA